MYTRVKKGEQNKNFARQKTRLHQQKKCLEGWQHCHVGSQYDILTWNWSTWLAFAAKQKVRLCEASSWNSSQSWTTFTYPWTFTKHSSSRFYHFIEKFILVKSHFHHFIHKFIPVKILLVYDFHCQFGNVEDVADTDDLWRSGGKDGFIAKCGLTASGHEEHFRASRGHCSGTSNSTMRKLCRGHNIYFTSSAPGFVCMNGGSYRELIMGIKVDDLFDDISRNLSSCKVWQCLPWSRESFKLDNASQARSNWRNRTGVLAPPSAATWAGRIDDFPAPYKKRLKNVVYRRLLSHL